MFAFNCSYLQTQKSNGQQQKKKVNRTRGNWRSENRKRAAREHQTALARSALRGIENQQADRHQRTDRRRAIKRGLMLAECSEQTSVLIWPSTQPESPSDTAPLQINMLPFNKFNYIIFLIALLLVSDFKAFTSFYFILPTLQTLRTKLVQLVQLTYSIHIESYWPSSAEMRKSAPTIWDFVFASALNARACSTATCSSP